MWAAACGESFFERLDDPRLLSGVLRTPADVREGQRRQQIGDGPLAVNHTKAFFDDPLQVDTSPANHAVHLWIGAGFHDRREFAHLFLRQEPGTARTGTVFQAIWPFVIEAMRPISQVWRSIPPTFAASVRLTPSYAAAKAKSRRTWRGAHCAWPSPEAQGCHNHPEGQCMLTWRISFASLESHQTQKGNPPRVRNLRRWYNTSESA